MDNFIHISEANPVIFYDKARVNIDAYQTKHFEKYMFSERLYNWQQREEYCQIWQTTDIINLQFTSSFDPINVKLIDKYGITKVSLLAIIGIPNFNVPNTWIFEVSLSLANLSTGCYHLEIECGTGLEKKTLISDHQFISDTPIKTSLLLEYFNTTYHNDIIFESGIKFQFRVHGNFGFLEPVRNDDKYKDLQNKSTLISSRIAKQWPVYFGNEFGLPDDIINILSNIWSCDNVTIDGKLFCIQDKFDFVAVDRYPKRGVKIVVEDGINRNSRIFYVNTDTTKQLITSIVVEAKVFGDLSSAGSLNTVPVYNIIQE